jgi:hypothetical protein
MTEWRDERSLNDTEALRRLVRRGLELDERVADADERARDAVEEMRDVRRQWERERRRVLIATALVAAGVSFMPDPGLVGLAVAGVGLVAIALLAGGIVDRLAGRTEGVRGLTEPPGPARDDG